MITIFDSFFGQGILPASPAARAQRAQERAMQAWELAALRRNVQALAEESVRRDALLREALGALEDGDLIDRIKAELGEK